MDNLNETSNNLITIQLEIPGIKCRGCIEKIQNFLQENYPNLLFETKEIETDFDKKIFKFHLNKTEMDNLKISKKQFKKIIESIDSNKFSSKIISPTTTTTSTTSTPLIDQSQESNQTDCSTDPLLLLSSNGNPKITTTTKMDSNSKRRKCFISIQGMTCSSCVDKIENKLKKTNGILSCQIGLITAKAEIDFNPEKISPELILDLLDDMGYEVQLISIIDSNQQSELRLDIMGITSEQDKFFLKKSIQELIGVDQIQFIDSNSSNRVAIIYYSNVIGPRKIADKICELGFTVHTINSFDPEKFTETMKKEVKKWRQSFLISLIFGLPTIFSMIYFMYLGPLIFQKHHQQNNCCILVNGLSLENLILFLLSTPVQIFGAKYFYIQAFKSLRNRHLSMDVLIMLATTIAYIYSCGVLLYFILTKQLKSPMTFFDTPPMLLLFISLGRWLEHLNRLQTTEYIVNLMSLRPLKATLLDVEKKKKSSKTTAASDTTIDQDQDQEYEILIKNERMIDIDLVEKGDYLRVRPGERIPTDGRMLIGKAMVDESFINGESMPVAKKSGSLLLGGSIVSNGIVIMLATNVGADSQLCQIVKMVENAQTTKAPIQQLADRISTYFIPFVIFTSLLTFIIWLWLGSIFLPRIISLNPEFYKTMTNQEIIIQFAFQIGLSVMIISCPCALGIATPSAVIIGTGIGAINGIHIKGAEPLEKAQNLTTIIFDKTGTLTYGKPSVTNLKLLYRLEDNQNDSVNDNSKKTEEIFLKKLLILIGMTESNSNDHPIAIAVVNFIKKILKLSSDYNFIQLDTKFKLEAGLGIKCQIDGKILEQFFNSIDQEQDQLEDQDSTPSSSLMFNNNISYASYLMNNDNTNDTDQDDNDNFKLSSNFFNSNQQQSFKIIIGNQRWIQKNQIKLNSKFLMEYEKLESMGETVFFVTINGYCLCLISVADTVKPEALLAIYSLRKLYNLDIMLLTGDNIRSALSIGKKIGINHIFAELLPQHKMDKIKNLQSMGKRIAMIGDGINDAPALAQSDLGIAIAKGTDITMESADVVLTKDDLLDIVSCIDLSKKTMQRIRINFLLAFIYNLIFIPIAAGIFIKIGLILQPWMSGACMAFSSISVSCSSLLLRRYRKPTREQLETDDYFRYKTRIEQSSSGGGGGGNSPSHHHYHNQFEQFDQLSLHNSNNLTKRGVTKIDYLNQPITNLMKKFSNNKKQLNNNNNGDNGRRQSSTTDFDDEDVQLINMNDFGGASGGGAGTGDDKIQIKPMAASSKTTNTTNNADLGLALKL